MRSVFWVCAVGLAIVILVPVTADQASQPGERMATSAAVDRGPDGRLNSAQKRHLIDVANNNRVTSINVVLDIEWIPEGYLTSEEAIIQRERIANAQNEIIDHLALLGLAEDVWRYKYIPMLDVEYSEPVVYALDELPIAKRLEVAAFLSPPAMHQTSAAIEADVLWNNRGVDGTGQVVALLDSGVTPAHQALNGKIVAEACFSTHKPNTGQTSLCFGGDTSHPQYPTQHSTAPGSAVDCEGLPGCGHGTQMAGLIVADGGTNFKGIAHGAKLIAIQVHTKDTNDGIRIGATNSDTAKALDYVFGLRNAYNIAAVNMSYGSIELFSSTCDHIHSGVTSAAANLRSVGIIPVSSAGNDASDTSINLPACTSHVVAVGAVLKDAPDTVWTGQGVPCPGCGSNSSPLLDFWAPPGDVESTTGQDGSIVGTCCTSAASAVASGAIALLRSGYPGYVTNRTIIDALMSAGVPVTDSRNGVTRPRISLDLALPPTNLSVNSFPCSGSTWVTWGGSMPDHDSFRVYSSPYPFPDIWHPEWIGSSTSAFFNVNQDSYIGVQAVLGNRFGGVHGSFDIAYGPC